jgi:hypothetical protein
MSSSSSLYFRLGHLTGLSQSDLQASNATPQSREGTIAWVMDAFGPKIMKYVKNISNSTMAVAELVGYSGDGANVLTTTITDITAGSTTSATTTGLTADDQDGKICFVLDNADSAGAAPEGEMGIVSNNTATIITLDSGYPLSVALAVNDDLELVTTYQVVDAADGDEAWTVTGVVVAQDGILDNEFGWVVQEGMTPALHPPNAITEGDPIVAGAAVVDAFGSDGQELFVGIAGATCSTDETLKHIPAIMKLFACTNTAASP